MNIIVTFPIRRGGAVLFSDIVSLKYKNKTEKQIKVKLKLNLTFDSFHEFSHL